MKASLLILCIIGVAVAAPKFDHHSAEYHNCIASCNKEWHHPEKNQSCKNDCHGLKRRMPKFDHHSADYHSCIADCKKNWHHKDA